jgi:hypothetical protein
MADVWYIVGLPIDVDDDKINGVFNVWGTQNTDWKAVLYDPTVSKGANPWKTDLPMSQGRGAFAMPFDANKTLTLSGKSRDITKPYVIPLKPGWNIASNPLPFGRYWNDETISVRKDGMVMSITDASLADLVFDTIFWSNRTQYDGDGNVIGGGSNNDIGGEMFDAVSSDPNVPNQAWDVDGDVATTFPAALGPYSGFWVLAWEECELLVSPTARGPEDVPSAPAPPSPAITGEPLVKLRPGLKPPTLPGLERIVLESKVDSTALLQNFPNPFNPETWLPYQLSKEADVTIHIYDVKGSLVSTLMLGPKSSGFYLTRDKAAHWDGRNKLGEKVASGIYFYQLRTKSFTSPLKKMLIVK